MTERRLSLVTAHNSERSGKTRERHRYTTNDLLFAM